MIWHQKCGVYNLIESSLLISFGFYYTHEATMNHPIESRSFEPFAAYATPNA
jgi:hypothetical protein